MTERSTKEFDTRLNFRLAAVILLGCASCKEAQKGCEPKRNLDNNNWQCPDNRADIMPGELAEFVSSNASLIGKLRGDLPINIGKTRQIMSGVVINIPEQIDTPIKESD